MSIKKSGIIHKNKKSAGTKWEHKGKKALSKKAFCCINY